MRHETSCSGPVKNSQAGRKQQILDNLHRLNNVFHASWDVCLGQAIRRTQNWTLNPPGEETGAGGDKSFGHAPISLRGVIRRDRASSCEIQFFCSTKDDFITRAASSVKRGQWKDLKFIADSICVVCTATSIFEPDSKAIS